MDNAIKENVEVVVEIICCLVVLGLISFVTIGQQLYPIFISLMGS